MQNTNKTKGPIEVKSLYEVPNTTKEGKYGVEHGIHHVKTAWGECFVTYLSNGLRLQVSVIGDFAQVPVSRVEEAWGIASYYSTQYDVEYKSHAAPLQPNELRNALHRIIEAWHGQNHRLVEVMPEMNVIIYRSWYSIGD
jgi:hypothetical protein